MQLNQITVPVTDVERSVAFYKTMGLQLIVLSAHYARFIVPGNEATFSVHLAEKFIPSETVIYFECDDVDKTVQMLERKGLVFIQQPADQSWLWREAYLNDPDGNKICFYYAGENRLNPPWRIKD